MVGSYGKSILNIWAISLLSSRTVALLYLATNSGLRYIFPHIHARIDCFLISVMMAFLTGVGWNLIVFLICISLVARELALFHMSTSHLDFIFLEVSVNVLCSFLNWIVCSALGIFALVAHVFRVSLPWNSWPRSISCNTTLRISSANLMVLGLMFRLWILYRILGKNF